MATRDIDFAYSDLPAPQSPTPRGGPPDDEENDDSAKRYSFALNASQNDILGVIIRRPRLPENIILFNMVRRAEAEVR